MGILSPCPSQLLEKTRIPALYKENERLTAQAQCIDTSHFTMKAVFTRNTSPYRNQGYQYPQYSSNSSKIEHYLVQFSWPREGSRHPRYEKFQAWPIHDRKITLEMLALFLAHGQKAAVSEQPTPFFITVQRGHLLKMCFHAELAATEYDTCHEKFRVEMAGRRHA